MPTFIFNKLVRDQVLQRCLDDPKVRTKYRILEAEELKKQLIAKIYEEAAEIPIQEKADDEVRAEIADLQTVIDTLRAAYDLTEGDIKQAQLKKQEKNGNFDKRAYIEQVDLDDDSEWISYFRSDPSKFKEIK